MNRSFLKEAFKSKCRKIVIIHYLGDESMAVDYPHGNAESLCDSSEDGTKRSAVVERGRAELCLRSLQKKIAGGLVPGHSMLIPRNIKQVSNAQYSTRQRMRLTRDATNQLA